MFFPASPLMAFHVNATASRVVLDPIHEQQKFECVHVLQPASEARLPPVVDHLVIFSPVTTFVSYALDRVPGVRVSASTQDAVESIYVQAHRATGLKIGAKSNRFERILVEIFLPSPHSLSSVEARDRAIVVLESALTNDMKANVRLHHVGECQVFASSLTPMTMNSLTLDPQGGGLMQVVAPSISVNEYFEANVSAMGKTRVFTGKLTAPVVTMETAGYGSVQIAALELDVSTKLSTSAVGQAHVTTIGDSLRTAFLSAATSGMGAVDVLAFKELLAHAVECEASGCGEVHVASHYAHCDVSRLLAAGKATVDARDVVAREAHVHAAGASTAVFRASEAAHTKITGYGTATLVGVLPPRVTGHPIPTPALASLVDERSATARKPPVTIPSRRDAFEHRETAWTELHLPSMADFASSLKTLWGGGAGHRDGHEEPDHQPAEQRP